MKKRLCSLMALLLVLTMLVGCSRAGNSDTNTGSGDAGSENSAAGESADFVPGIYADLSGIETDEIVMTVNDVEIPADMYFYWLTYACSQLEKEISYYSSFGVYGEFLNEDGSLKWEEPFGRDMTLSQYAGYRAQNSLTYYAVIDCVAREHGFALDDDDRAVLDAEREAAIVQMGGQEAYQQYMKTLGLSAESFERLSSASFLIDDLVDLILTEGSALYLDPQDYNEYATYADHILLSITDEETGNSLTEDEVAALEVQANDLVAQLRASDDVMTLFDQLADEHSDDPGREGNPTGYVYTPGTMVTVFENAASALEPGQVSDPVKSTYGYHIILRKELAEGLEQHPEMIDEIVNDHLDTILALETENANVTVSDKVASIDPATFYSEYLAACEAIAGEGQ